MPFIKAERRKSKVRIWLSGMSSAGKTYTALELATGFGGKIGLIDTEAGRGHQYGEKFDYSVTTLTAPFLPESYINAIAEAEKAGIECLVIDSMSQEWQTLLEEKGKLDEKGGNSFVNWNKPTRRHNAFVEAITQSSIPLILMTCRVKRDYVISENDRGKMEPRLVGLANIQRDGFEYEMTIEFRIDKNHEAEAIKDNTGLFLGQPAAKLTKATGKLIREWHSEGKEPPPQVVKCENCSLKGLQTPATGEETDGHKFCKPCSDKYKELEAVKSSKE